MIKAVIFDMDGLMIDSEPIQSKSFEIILREYGQEPILHDNGLVQKVGLKSKENWKFLKERHGFDEDTDTLVEKKRKVYIDILKENIQPMPLEDSMAGVISAFDAGVKVIAVPSSSTKKEDFSKANLIVGSLEDINWDILTTL